MTEMSRSSACASLQNVGNKTDWPVDGTNAVTNSEIERKSADVTFVDARIPPSLSHRRVSLRPSWS